MGPGEPRGIAGERLRTRYRRFLGYIQQLGIKARLPRRPEITRPFAEQSGNETRILSGLILGAVRPRNTFDRRRGRRRLYRVSPPPGRSFPPERKRRGNRVPAPSRTEQADVRR